MQGPRGVLGSGRLVRGLYNADGQYNCFLNVIIQALWHIKTFRQSLLESPTAAVTAATPGPRTNGPLSKGSAAATKSQEVTAADLKILQALRSVFEDLAKAPGLPAEQQQQQTATAGSDQASGQQDGSSSSSGWWLVSPAVLREALSGLQLGAAAISIELSEMHDASEVLNEVFTALHRAEAGRATGIADDPHLPTKVKVKPDIFAVRKQPPAAAAALPPQQPLTLAHMLQMNGVAGNGQPQMNGIGGHKGGSGSSADLGVNVKPPTSLVHALFGLDVLQAHAADAGVGSRSGGGVKKAVSGGGGAGGKDGSSQVEAMQFMKFFHLMPAQVSCASLGGVLLCLFDICLRLLNAWTCRGAALTLFVHTSAARCCA